MTDLKNNPVCLAGKLSSVANMPSLCMDSATHFLETPFLGQFRVVPDNEEVRTALESLAAGNSEAYVCGYPRRSANCHHIQAIVALPIGEFPSAVIQQMGGTFAGSD